MPRLVARLVARLAAIDCLIGWLFVVMVATLPFIDNMWPSTLGTKATYRGAMAATAFLFILQGFMQEWLMWRGAPARRGLSAAWFAARLAAVFWGLWFVAWAVARPFVAHEGFPETRIFLRDFHWVSTLVMATALVRRNAGFARTAEGAWAYPFTIARGALHVLFTLGLASCAASVDPSDSFRDFRNDLGGSLGSLMILLHVVKNPAPIRRIVWAILGAALFITLVNVIGLVRFTGGDETEKLYWMANNIVYSDDYFFAPDRALLKDFDYRPAYPFAHHNRLSNFAMMATGTALLLLVWPGTPRRSRFLAFVALVAFSYLLNRTMGRGALLALGGGLALAVAPHFRWRRPLHWGVVVGTAAVIVGLFFVIPDRQQHRLKLLWDSLAQPLQKAPDLSKGFDGNILRRIRAIKTARAAMEAHPWLGLGYGYHVYEIHSRQFAPQDDIPDPQVTEQYQSHSHNNLLQVGAEVGIPALLAYLVFHLCAGAILFAAAQHQHRTHGPMRWALSAALALFLMIHLFGMTNYSLRYTLGHLVWLTAGLLMLLALRGHSARAPHEVPGRPAR